MKTKVEGWEIDQMRRENLRLTRERDALLAANEILFEALDQYNDYYRNGVFDDTATARTAIEAARAVLAAARAGEGEAV